MHEVPSPQELNANQQRKRRASSKSVRSVATLAVAAVILLPLQGGAQRRGHPEKFDAALSQIVDKGAHGTVRVIISATPGARRALASAIVGHGDRIEADHPSIDALTTTIHASDLVSLSDNPSVGHMSIDAPVAVFQTTGGTNPTLATNLLPMSPYNGNTVGVAVIDSGVDPGNDLAKRVPYFYDFTRTASPAPSTPYDDYGHGTHVAGLVAGNGANSSGYYAGMAPATKIIALKVLDATGAGYTSTVIQAIDFAVANKARLGVDIINMSLGLTIFESS